MTQNGIGKHKKAREDMERHSKAQNSTERHGPQSQELFPAGIKVTTMSQTAVMAFHQFWTTVR